MENHQEKLRLELTVEEVNKILSALGNLPYAQVFNLIQNIHHQVGPQLQNSGSSDKGE